MNIFSAKGASIKESVIADSEIVVILPMKNEITNVERKISSVIPEILPMKMRTLLLLTRVLLMELSSWRVVCLSHLN